jgi:hypothetical protein
MNMMFIRLHLWLLATGNWYEPAPFAITETTDGLLACTDSLTYGDGFGSTPGLLEVTLFYPGGYYHLRHVSSTIAQSLFSI